MKYDKTKAIIAGRIVSTLIAHPDPKFYGPYTSADSIAEWGKSIVITSTMLAEAIIKQCEVKE